MTPRRGGQPHRPRGAWARRPAAPELIHLDDRAYPIIDVTSIPVHLEHCARDAVAACRYLLAGFSR